MDGSHRAAANLPTHRPIHPATHSKSILAYKPIPRSRSSAAAENPEAAVSSTADRSVTARDRAPRGEGGGYPSGNALRLRSQFLRRIMTSHKCGNWNACKSYCRPIYESGSRRKRGRETGAVNWSSERNAKRSGILKQNSGATKL